MTNTRARGPARFELTGFSQLISFSVGITIGNAHQAEITMRRLITFLCIAFLAMNVQALEIATCRSPIGKAFYHYDGLMDKASAGWNDDKISDGVFSLTISADQALDLLYVDFAKKPVSSVQAGGLVRILRRSATDLTVIVLYPESTTEIYSFFKERDGTFRFTLLQNKTGDGVILPKSSLMVGLCDPIRFELVQ